MTHDEILVQLTDVFRDVFGDPDLVLTPSTTAEDIADWDSMRHITIVVGAEQHFGIRFHSAEVEKLHNVGDFVELIAKRLEAKG